MVTRGLKAGDLFCDGGRTYKVIRTLANGDYVSEAVSSGNEEAASKDAASDLRSEKEREDTVHDPEDVMQSEVSKQKTYTKRQIQRMTKANLEQLTRELGVEFTGTEAARAEVLKKLGL